VVCDEVFVGGGVRNGRGNLLSQKEVVVNGKELCLRKKQSESALIALQ